MKQADKQGLKAWDEYRKQVMQSTPVDLTESLTEQKRRVEKLEADPEAWFKYYFPKFAFAEPAPFHKAATKRVLANRRWYEVRAWSRELAKSTRTMMEVLFMTLTKKRFNVLMISNSNDNAERLLKPYKINLESNQRLIQDYEKQESYGDWTSGEFVTTQGVAFRAIGAGQSPRGSRAEEKRIDTILVDDFDTDEECKNQKIVKRNGTGWSRPLSLQSASAEIILLSFAATSLPNFVALPKPSRRLSTPTLSTSGTRMEKVAGHKKTASRILTTSLAT